MSDQPPSGSDLDHGPETAFDARSKLERRQDASAMPMPPGGVERRQWRDRRKARSSEGRERYLDMVQRERGMMLELGVNRSTEQLLDMAGAPSVEQTEAEATIRDRATGDQLH